MQLELPFIECVHNAYPSDNMTDLDACIHEILQGMPVPFDAYIAEILQGMPDPEGQQLTDLDDRVPYPLELPADEWVELLSDAKEEF